MPSERTIASELAVGAGIRNGTLSTQTVLTLGNVTNVEARIANTHFTAHPPRYNRLFRVGISVGEHIIRSGSNTNNIEWTGSDDYEGPGAQDLLVAGQWMVSIKEDSQILLNGSAQRVIEMFPRGRSGRFRGLNWFVRTAPGELERYFAACNGPEVTGIQTCRELFSARRSREDKRRFSQHVAALHREDGPHREAYQAMCRRISRESASIFNRAIEQSRNEPDYRPILDRILYESFRINTSRYILCGSQRRSPFALIVPDMTTWRRNFSVERITANERMAGQPEVEIVFQIRNRTRRVTNIFTLRAEIRWSHGKFSGNPEAKLYKTFDYSDLPWITTIPIA